MKSRFLFCLLLFFTCTFCHSQNLSGFWKGSLTFKRGSCFPVNNLELQINIKDNGLTGDSYHYLDINNYVKKKIAGTFDGGSLTLSVQEGLITTFKIPTHCTPCIKNYQLTYSNQENTEVLSGTWTGKIMTTMADCEPGQITLTRTKESAFKEVPEIKVDTGTIRLDLYDNGHVDGDSITVLVNNKVVLSHQKLSVKAITAFIKIDLQNLFQQVEMVAENLGSIPPNTALLIVTAGANRYNLYLTSTKDKNAMVRFVYEPPEVN